MNSISKKCQEAKEKYDACFNTWFSERYLKGHVEDECDHLFRVYQRCVKEAVAEHKIELWNLPSEYDPATSASSTANSTNSSPSSSSSSSSSNTKQTNDTSKDNKK